MNEKPILLLQTGDAPDFVRSRCGNFDDMFRTTAGLAALPRVTVHAANGERIAECETYRAVVVTGSPAMVTERLAWSEYAAGWLREAVAADLPVFGVCYGHQLLAHALGGRVDYHPQGEEVGTFDIELTSAGREDPLTRHLPERFPANLAHGQTVLEPPPGAVVLARSAHDPHQMLRYGGHAVGVQFHPEFDRAACLACLDLFARDIPAKAELYKNLRESATDTPLAAGLIRRFLKHI